MLKRLLDEGFEEEDIRYAISCFGDSDYTRLINMLKHNEKLRPSIPRSDSDAELARAISMSLRTDDGDEAPSISKTNSDDELQRAIKMSLSQDDQVVPPPPLLRTSSSVSESLQSRFQKDCSKAKNQLNKINNMMRSVGSNFVDAAFRPNSTLLLFGTETESKRRNIGRWLRPSEIRGVRAATISEARLERYVFVKRGSQHTHIHTHTHTHTARCRGQCFEGLSILMTFVKENLEIAGFSAH